MNSIGYESEKKIVQNFCHTLVEGKVNTTLLRQMTGFSEIPFWKFESLLKDSFNNYAVASKKCLNEYKNKIITLICIANAGLGLLKTLPHDLVKVINGIAVMNYNFAVNNIFSFDKAKTKLILPVNNYFELGILQNITFILSDNCKGDNFSKKNIEKVNHFCDLLDGKITEEEYIKLNITTCIFNQIRW